MRVPKSFFFLILIVCSLSSFEAFACDLVDCVRSGYVTSTEEALKRGELPDQFDRDGESILGYAVSEGYGEIVELLIKYKANTNIKDKSSGDTPLIKGTSSLKIIKMLLAAKADPRIVNNNNENPLHFSTYSENYLPVVKALLAAGADPNGAAKDTHRTPLMDAAGKTKGVPQIIKAMIAGGANLEHTGRWDRTALFIAVEYNSLLSVKALISAGANAQYKMPETNESMLTKAASEHGNVEIGKLLLAAGVDVNAQTSFGSTALSHAVYKNHQAFVEFLLSNNANPNLLNKRGENVVFTVVKENNLLPLKMLSTVLAAGAWTDLQGRFGHTPLKLALYRNDLDFIKALLDAGASPSFADADGTSPFFHAIRANRFDVINMMIQSGNFDVNHSDAGGETPLNWALSNGHFDLVEDFIALGADVNKEGVYGASPLQIAVAFQAYDIANWFLELGANPNAASNFGLTAMHEAADDKPGARFIKLLYENAAKLELRNNMKATPLVYASTYGVYENIEMLIRLGADVNSQDSNGSTALINLAGKGKQYKAIKRLIKAKAKVNQRSFDGNTALFFAVQNKDIDIARLFCSAGADPDHENLNNKSARELSVEIDDPKLIDAISNCDGFTDLELSEIAIEWLDPHWVVKAKVRNVGTTKLTKRFDIRIEQLTDKAPSVEGPYDMVMFSPASHPAIEAGEEVEIEWRTDTPTDTGNRIDFSTKVEAYKFVLDYKNEIEELDEENNETIFVRVSCDDKTYSAKNTVYTDKSLDAGERYSDRLGYDPVLGRIAAVDPAKAVLCKIKMDAQRRAKLGGRTSRGSRFIRNFSKYFLQEYYNDRTILKAKETVLKISDHQFYPNFGFGAILNVPKGLRDLYPNTGHWPRIYPATEFWNIRGNIGKYVNWIPVIDVPFLVGGNTTFSGDNDFVAGGRNRSQVMHWATGMRYYYIPENAYRELFLGYEYWHLEGFDVFGEDSINDLIAEEQGRLFGLYFVANNIANDDDLVRYVDRTFLEARAWVGALIKHRQKDLDKLILQKEIPKGHKWWKRYERMPPWKVRGSQAHSIRDLLEDIGQPVKTVYLVGLVERLTEIYTLIYEVEEWEKTHGKMHLTEIMKNTLDGKYDDQFIAAPKEWSANWIWRPLR